MPYARLCSYILDASDALYVRERPLILLCPGGGYEHTSDREAEPLAMRFLAMGYHVSILRYSCAPAVYPAALLELATAVRLIREMAGEWHVMGDQIYVQGCSAGGHLACCLGAFWHEPWLAERVGAASSGELRPAGMILCYPVITSGEFAHRGSIENLLGGPGDEKMLERVSLEKQVTGMMPPAFIWHTYSDESVPVENSLLLVGAMRKSGVQAEFHMYPVGAHGLSACDEQTARPDGFGVQKECQSWLPLAREWLALQTGGF